MTKRVGDKKGLLRVTSTLAMTGGIQGVDKIKNELTL
jgi:hypothetical protein